MWTTNATETIMNECNKQGLSVSKDLISFLVNLHKLHPDIQTKENTVDGQSEDISKIVQKLLLTNRPSLLTLKIQLYFIKHYGARSDIIQKHRQRLKRKTQQLISEVCNITKVSNSREVEKLYQKILVIIILLSGLGNPMDNLVLKETAIALQSVYLPSELNHFVTLCRNEKKNELMELVSIVAGIRLFNKDSQRGGEGIDDLPHILQEAVKKSRESILEWLEDLMKTIYRYTAATETIVTLFSSQASESLNCDDSALWIIELLTACRQQEIYIRKLLADVEYCENEIKLTITRLKSRLLKLHDTVRFRTAIPTVQVYPQFIDLSDTWTHLQNEVIVLSHINNLICQMKALCTKNIDIHEKTNEIKVDRFIKNTEIPSDAERLERSMGKLITECGDCPIFYPSGIKDFENIHLEFLGFCAWSFTIGYGALIPGNPNIGIVRWRTKYFAFSSNEAAKQFGHDPNRYVHRAIDFVRRHPEYIHLFQLQDDIESIKNSNELLDREYTLKTHEDKLTQTDVHFLLSNMDCQYHHSIWEYRKRTLKLVNISRCTTRSTQTGSSHFKIPAKVQTSTMVTASVQTQRDTACNTNCEN